ncbi:sensor histidine kinase [Diplocloster modestus]|uniref:histidine kinase n=1 Tax=Diplocloster modestus TaxID=2850322 RepID=A0ABS6KF62_9FIRM|nr:HAMP domain-containing sensor histidine kinase [Diplocloster modestus]MBU9729113.1 HAMP domain-containing histidine kinase [Diplocloster modestus]
MLKMQIRHLNRQMCDLAGGASDKMLDISLMDRDLEKLAGVLNRYHTRQRYTVAQALRHEEHLKESIANISHDLRTPLTVILGHLQLLQKSDLTPEQYQRIETVLHKAERMKEFIGAFYDLSVLDSDQVTPRKERINLSNLLIDLLTENAPAMESRGICPDMILPDHSIFILSDRDMTERIFQNLLTNAIRYTAGIIRIRLSQDEKGRILFCIENTVSEDLDLDTARIFERFYTGDTSRHSGSSGLGLAVVKLLTVKLDGQISAEMTAGGLAIRLML